MIDALYALQSLDTLRDVTVADTVSCLLFWGSCTDQASAETPGNGRTGLAGGLCLLHLQDHVPNPHTVETQL